MRLFGLHDHSLAEIYLWFPIRERAEDELGRILRDEPGWYGKFSVVEVEVGRGRIEVVA